LGALQINCSRRLACDRRQAPLAFKLKGEFAKEPNLDAGLSHPPLTSALLTTIASSAEST
jgi:hypothetical protein